MTEHKCPQCKRIVYLDPAFWSYKLAPGKGGDPKYYCSWHCLQAAREQRKNGRRRRKIRCVETGHLWRGASEAADVLGITQEAIYECARSGKGVFTFLPSPETDGFIHLEYAP